MNTKKFELWYPVKPWGVNQIFGVNGEYYRKNGINIKGHNGIDAYCRDGQNVRAAHDGEVVFTGVDGSGGLGVVLKTLEAFDYEGKPTFFKTIYWHLKTGTIAVKPGQKVTTGTILAEADNTGFSSGTHLHFGLKPIYENEEMGTWYNLNPDNGYMGAIDPMPYFTGYCAFDSQTVMDILRSEISVYKKIVEILNLQRYGR